MIGLSRIVAEIRLWLSRSSRAALPASRSRVAQLPSLRVRESRVASGNVARPLRVVPFTPRAVGVSSLDAALARECVEESEVGSFI